MTRSSFDMRSHNNYLISFHASSSLLKHAAIYISCICPWLLACMYKSYFHFNLYGFIDISIGKWYARSSFNTGFWFGLQLLDNVGELRMYPGCFQSNMDRHAQLWWPTNWRHSGGVRDFMVAVDYLVLLAFGMSLRAAISRIFSMSTTYKPNEEMLDCGFPSRGPLNEI